MPTDGTVQPAVPIRLLILEDRPLDAELMVEQLRLAGHLVEWLRVDNETDFSLRIDDGVDLVLADYSLPQFSALDALRIVQARGGDVPLIVVSGTIGEELAAACIREGAIDYVLKDRLARLPSAVRMALENSRLRRAQRQVTEELRRSEAMLLTAQRVARLGSWELVLHQIDRLEANPVRWSAEAGTIYGLPPDTDEVPMAGSFFRALFGEREREGLAALAEVVRTGRPYDALRHLVLADGARRIVHEHAEMLFDDAVHRPSRLIGTVQDITERQRAEAELRESEQRYRLLFERSPHPVWVFEQATLRFLAVNTAACEHYGYNRADFLQLTILDMLPLGEREAAERRLRERGVPARRCEPAQHRRRDGEIVAVEVSSGDIVFGDRPARLQLVNDVTERERAERIRRESEERFSTIFRASPAAIGIGTVQEGRLTEVNGQFTAFFGYERDEMIDRTMAELGLWADAADLDRTMQRLRTEKSVRALEGRFRRKSGETRIGLLAMEILDFGQVPMLLTMLTDVTDTKQLQAELFRALRVESLGRLAGGIAHDMNNVLAPIMMSVPLLRMDLAPDDVAKTLGTIESSAKRGADLVRQLLIFARGVEGARGPVAPQELIQEVIKMVRQTFPRSIRIATKVPRQLWPVRGDATQLHQVLLNLCVNARDAMPDGGALAISAENVEIDAHYVAMHPDAKPGRYVLLTVTDSGTGIAPEIVDRIFDPFFTTKELGQGTGLGLSTVLGIVKGHQGFVHLRSELGRGTTFLVHLPACLDAVEPAAEEAPRTIPSGHGETILVVEDEENIREVLRDMLTLHNYKVLTAGDGAEASALFARVSAEVKLVVTDLDMPFVDGMKLIPVLRRISPTVKIVVSSGLGSRVSILQRAQELEEFGIAHVLDKPYTAEKMLQIVHQALVAPPVPTRSKASTPSGTVA